MALLHSFKMALLHTKWRCSIGWALDPAAKWPCSIEKADFTEENRAKSLKN
jgi:hypothetical protein